jgi:hypothetical protein
MNFCKTFESDFIHCGKIDLPWDQVDQDLKSVEKDTSRSHSIAPGSNDYSDDALQKTLDTYRKYGYTEHNTILWKTTAREPKLTFDWEQTIIDQLPLDHAVAALTRQDPGQILPWHEDKFFMLRRLYPEDVRPIWRFLLMMEDWKIGHILQINNSVFSHWKRGDVVVWKPSTMHLAANAGIEVKWTCNITGFLNI